MNSPQKGVRKDRFDGSFFEPGEYGKSSNGDFYCCVPGILDALGNLRAHKIVEHEDGTITVSPSILISYGPHGINKWHGYLERGIWREV